MADEKNTKKNVGNDKEKSENWPEEAVQDILDYIEEQGIYIRE